jgi:sarcosine oxidase subunit beta
VEAGDLGAQASGANAGSLHLQIQYPEFVAYGEGWARAYAPCLRFLKASLSCGRRLPGRVGEDLDVKLAGGLVVARTPAQMRHHRGARRGSKRPMASRRDPRRTRCATLRPISRTRRSAAGFCALEGKANPLRATPAMLRRAAQRRRGGALRGHAGDRPSSGTAKDFASRRRAVTFPCRARRQRRRRRGGAIAAMLGVTGRRSTAFPCRSP